LDTIDLRILNQLGINSRLSYRNIARSIDFTTKSAKERVDNMISSGVINRFIVLVDSLILGYNRVISFALKKDLVDKETIEKIKQIGDIQFQFTVLGGVIGFSLLVKDEGQSNKKIEDLIRFPKPALQGLIVQDQISERKLKAKTNLNGLEYHIIKQLVLNPRIEIYEMAKNLSVSPKTIRRRFDKIQENHLLEFTLLPNPKEVKGHVVFFMDIRIVTGKKLKSVSERIYHQLRDYLILSRIFNSKDTIGLVLACEAIIDVENIRSLIESIDGVAQSRIFLPTAIEYNQERILTAIDRVSLESLTSLLILKYII
jgi:DNA-binding Lrp family transcriptional regulator